MQRIMVDLPEPDGPQITMRSRRSTARLMSRSTWNSPYHLCMPMISTASALDCAGAASAAWLMTFPSLAPVGFSEPGFHALGVARHAVAEDEVKDRREHVAGRACRRR